MRKRCALIITSCIHEVTAKERWPKSRINERRKTAKRQPRRSSNKSDMRSFGGTRDAARWMQESLLASMTLSSLRHLLPPVLFSFFLSLSSQQMLINITHRHLKHRSSSMRKGSIDAPCHPRHLVTRLFTQTQFSSLPLPPFLSRRRAGRTKRTHSLLVPPLRCVLFYSTAALFCRTP